MLGGARGTYRGILEFDLLLQLAACNQVVLDFLKSIENGLPIVRGGCIECCARLVVLRIAQSAIKQGGRQCAADCPGLIRRLKPIAQ